MQIVASVFMATMAMAMSSTAHFSLSSDGGAQENGEPEKTLVTSERSERSEGLVIHSPADSGRVESLAMEYSYPREVALLASHSPRDRALAVRMIVLDGPERGRMPAHGTILRKAAEAASRDRVVQWIWATGSDEDGGCDAENPCPNRSMALAKLEPENGAAWIPVVTDAARNGNEVGVDDALARLAKASKYDEIYHDTLDAWTEALRRFPTTAPYKLNVDRNIDVGGDERLWTDRQAWYKAKSGSNRLYDELIQSCDHNTRRPPLTAMRIELCAKAGRLMLSKATTLKARIVGNHLLEISGTITARDRELAREAEWLKTPHQQLDIKPESAKWRELIDLYQNSDGEIKALEEFLRRHGVPLNPPAEWRSSREDGQ
jgi:hypothetical protein